MSLDRWLQVASESATVVQAFVWLFFAIGVFAYFRDLIRQFMRQAAELTVKARPGCIEATISRRP